MGRPDWRAKMRIENPEKLEVKRLQDKEYQRVRREANPSKKLQAVLLEKKKYPERVRARQWVNNAIRDGRLQRKKCRDCLRRDTHGHHADYLKPQEVIWLCPVHHKLEHQKVGSLPH